MQPSFKANLKDPMYRLLNGAKRLLMGRSMSQCLVTQNELQSLILVD